MQNQKPEDYPNEMMLTSEEIGFNTDELLACEKCSRTNPPNRLKCMYCGAPLELNDEQAASVMPNLRKLENWENGFNLIYLAKEKEKVLEESTKISKILGLETEVLEKIFEMEKSLPVGRAETKQDAEILHNRLQDSGCETMIVSDESLAAHSFPKRLRGLEILDNEISLILFNNDQIDKINVEDLILIVTGAVFQKNIQAFETRKKGETKILNASETASDELLIDIYTKNDPIGYRILTKGFDFSALGAEKGILARENIKKLIERLRAINPQLKLVEDYTKIRNILGGIWEVEQRRDSQGLTRQRWGKFDLSRVSSSSNLQQFTKYSRLQWHIL